MRRRRQAESLKTGMEHDPEKWVSGFRKRSCSTKKGRFGNGTGIPVPVPHKNKGVRREKRAGRFGWKASPAAEEAVSALG